MNVLIKFTDGEELIIHDADSFETSHNSDNWKVIKKQNCLYFRKEFVKYIGEYECIKEGGQGDN